MTDTEPESWDAEFRPRLMRLGAWAAAGLIAVPGIIIGILNNRAAGAYMRPADQFAWAGVALFIAAGILVLTRPRVRVGSRGVLVRNIVDDKLIPWSDVVDISFRPGKRWAQVDIEAHEYVPLVAVQAVDRDRAVAAMDTMRELMARYRPSAG